MLDHCKFINLQFNVANADSGIWLVRAKIDALSAMVKSALVARARERASTHFCTRTCLLAAIGVGLLYV